MPHGNGDNGQCRNTRLSGATRSRHSDSELLEARKTELKQPRAPVGEPLTLIQRLNTFQGGLRILQLAHLLGVGRSTLYDWVEAGTIPAYRHRGVIFFDPAIVAIWLRQKATVA